MFNYIESKKRINEILTSKTVIRDENHVPKSDSNYTYENGIKAWVGSIFIDIVGSREIFKNADESVARLIRAFTQETILIMKESALYRQIGIRGDCVYGIFDAGDKAKVTEIVELSIGINTLIELLNKQLIRNGRDGIKVGIGVAINKDLIIKAGVSYSGINDRVWIGQAVVKAAHLADSALREEGQYKGPILIDSSAYTNSIEILEKKDSRYRDWFTLVRIKNEKTYYADIHYDINEL